MAVTKQKFIVRDDLRDNRDKIYLFGDNLVGFGLKGQAAEMRGEPNAVGIPTKKYPSMRKDAFFCDGDFEQLKPRLDKIFESLKNKNIVIPEDGLGTGLAKLDKTAPKIFNYIQEQIKGLS